MSSTTPSRDENPVPDGEFPISWADFHVIAKLVQDQAGIQLPESKVNLVYSRLAKRLRIIGLRSFHDYCALVQGEGGGEERQAMIAAMTTNVTRFFREPHHFAHLKNELLPGLSARVRKGGRVRIWSAACSSGEEPYSTALTILGALPEATGFDIRILATDIDPNMVERGSKARYKSAQLNDIPVELRRWTTTVREGDELAFEMGDAAKSLASFKELNLLGRWPMTGPFDAIFCRNVMIYFDEETQRTICGNFARLLAPGAILYIGHSERIPVDHPDFELVGQTTYKLRSKTS